MILSELGREHGMAAVQRVAEFAHAANTSATAVTALCPDDGTTVETLIARTAMTIAAVAKTTRSTATATIAARVVAAGRDPDALAAIARDRSRVVPVRLTGDRVADTGALRDAAGGGATVALDLVGNASDPNATLAALHALRRSGRLVLMGSARVPIPVDYMALLANNWELLGQFMYPADGYRRLFDLVRAGLLDLTAITPHSYPLAELPAAMAMVSKVGSLACVVMTR